MGKYDASMYALVVTNIDSFQTKIILKILCISLKIMIMEKYDVSMNTFILTDVDSSQTLLLLLNDNICIYRF